MLAVSATVTGILKSDGTLELEKPPELPPGPVRVTLQVIPDPKQDAGSERLPDLPWLDDNIPAPFDLPRPDNFEPVEVPEFSEYLPERFESNEEQEE